MSAQPKLKWRPGTPVHLEPSDGKGLKTYSLIRAVYMDKLEDARAILKADPGQINLQEPYAGLTALHIAVFRSNDAIVELLVGCKGCSLDAKDNFGRTAVDMLLYGASEQVFAWLIFCSFE